MAYVDPSFRVKQAEIKRVVLAPARFTVYRLTAGGQLEADEEWSNSAQGGITMALQEELRSRVVPEITQLREEDLVAEQKFILARVENRLNQVNNDLRLNFYKKFDNHAPSEERASEVEDDGYGLGPQVKEISGQADTLLFVRGADARSTVGRHALQGGLLVLGVAVGALTGHLPIHILGSGQTTLSMALVDAHTGTVLWHRQIPNIVEGQYSSDVRNADGASQAIKQLFVGFPYSERSSGRK
jgi:hypothetical protein